MWGPGANGMSTPEYWRGKTILLTGGTGFVGRHLRRRLEELGAGAVIAVGSGELDLESTDDTMRWGRRLDRDVDVIFHLAAWAKPGAFGLHHGAELFARNTMINANVLRVWQECLPGARLIGIGSSCEYPGHLSTMSEEDLWNGEPHPSVFAYAMTKRMLYAGQCAYAQQYGSQTVHVICNTLYGPGDHFDEERGHVISALIDRFAQAAAKGRTRVVVWGDGYQTRECLFIDEQIHGLLLVAEKSPDRLVNLGTGVSHTIREIAETIGELCGYDGEIVYDTTKFVGIRHKVLNSDRARLTLGWNPTMPLREGLRRTVAWYQQHILPERLNAQAAPQAVRHVATGAGSRGLDA